MRLDRDRGKGRMGRGLQRMRASETQRDMLDIMMMIVWGKKNTGSDRDRTVKTQTQKVEVLYGHVCVWYTEGGISVGNLCMAGWLAGSAKDSMSSAWA